MSLVDETIAGWARAQTQYWTQAQPSRAAAKAAFAGAAARQADMFVFGFEGGTVRLLDKPQFSREQMELGDDQHCWRARQYLGFFQQVIAHVLSEGGPVLEGQLAMPMEDFAAGEPELPYFAFQKRAGSNRLLLPDIDALRLGFYQGGEEDRQTFAKKRDRAVFVGSTTGGIHSYDSVQDLAAPRLRSAMAFRGVPEVDFRAAHIVQCASEEAEVALRNLGFGVGTMPWTEQLGCKFLISMDGNGATCSRVALALKSNSALLKYASPYQLYYFGGLVAGYHYLPIGRDLDVVSVVRQEQAAPGRYAAVAANGTRFFEQFLGMPAAVAYAAQVLGAYFGCFAAAAAVQVAAAPAVALATGAAVPMQAVAHIAGRGDVSCDPAVGAGDAGSGWQIEGFSLSPTDGLGAGEIEYRAFYTGRTYAWSAGGAYTGSWGKHEGLRGVAIRLRGAAAGRDQCQYTAVFMGGETVGPVVDGAPCRSAHDAPMEMLRVEIRERAA